MTACLQVNNTKLLVSLWVLSLCCAALRLFICCGTEICELLCGLECYSFVNSLYSRNEVRNFNAANLQDYLANFKERSVKPLRDNHQIE